MRGCIVLFPECIRPLKHSSVTDLPTIMAGAPPHTHPSTARGQDKIITEGKFFLVNLLAVGRVCLLQGLTEYLRDVKSTLEAVGGSAKDEYYGTMITTSDTTENSQS